MTNLEDKGKKKANTLFGKTNEAVQHRIKTARIILGDVKQELLKQLQVFRDDTKLVQDDQVDQAKRQIEVLVEIFQFLQDNF